MYVPNEMQALIDRGLFKIKNDSKHDLNLGFREAIYWSFGPYRFGKKDSSIDGHKRRVALASIVTRRVLPIWVREWPTDTKPQTILTEVEQIMKTPRNQVDEDVVSESLARYWEYIDNLIERTRNLAGIVGLAAVKTLSLALWDDFADSEDIDYELLDSDEFTNNDTHFLAAAAYSGGPPYSIALAQNSDAQKRHEFWEWWLNDAVTAAWNSVK